MAHWRLAWQLAWRFRQSKKRSGFTSFISTSSTVGIGLGCYVLIVLLSVMNGFEGELKNRLLAILPHAELQAVAPEGIQDWQLHRQRFSDSPDVVLVQPYIRVTAMLQRGKQNKAAEIMAIDSQIAAQGGLIEYIPGADWQAFSQQPRSVLLGQKIAENLGLKRGDKVQLLLPQKDASLSLKSPKTLWLTFAGVIAAGGELDQHSGLMHLATAGDELGIQHGAQGLLFNFTDPFIAPRAIRKLGFSFDQHVYMSDWTRTQGHLYQDIQLVRLVVYLALTLVIAVACFNIVSSLVMAVNEKQAEIAMLKTSGATANLIVRTFMLQGMSNGLIGTFWGAVLGVITALNLTDMVKGLEQLSGYQVLSGDIYFIDFLPSSLQFQDVLVTVVIALGISLVATFYPALKASQIEPAKVLGH